MASTLHTPLNIKNAVISVDGIEYSDAITSATLTAESTDTTWEPVSGNIQTTTSALKWTCNLEFGQDVTANTTLTAKLLSLHGLNKTVIIKPTGTATQSWTFTATIKAPSTLGGGVGIATSSTTMPVSGQPTFVYGV
jgi:hypothetical protein